MTSSHPQTPRTQLHPLRTLEPTPVAPTTPRRRSGPATSGVGGGGIGGVSGGTLNLGRHSRVPSMAETEFQPHSRNQSHSHIHMRSNTGGTGVTGTTNFASQSQYSLADFASSSVSLSHFTGKVGEREVKSLMELQRVLYRGAGYYDEDGDEQGEVGLEDVEAFVKDCLEADCVYDTPLLTFPNRPLLLSAFLLSSTISTIQVPSIRPTALLTHTKSLASWSWNKLIQGLVRTSPYSTSSSKPTGSGNSNKGISPSIGESESIIESELAYEEDESTEGYGGASREISPGGLYAEIHASQIRIRAEAKKEARRSAMGQGSEAVEERNSAWWHPWEIRSECSEIGTMDCYDGFHLGYIDHTITVDVFPHLLPPHPSYPNPLASHMSDSPQNADLALSPKLSSTYKHAKPATSIPSALFQSLSTSLLRHSLPIQTIVHFNEHGRITYIRDCLDVRDLIEAVLPAGRVVGWIGRRLGGFAVAGVGSLFTGKPTESPIKGDLTLGRSTSRSSAGVAIKAIDSQRKGIIRKPIPNPEHAFVFETKKMSQRTPLDNNSFFSPGSESNKEGHSESNVLGLGLSPPEPEQFSIMGRYAEHTGDDEHCLEPTFGPAYGEATSTDVDGGIVSDIDYTSGM